MKESNIIKIKKMIAVSAAALTAFSFVSCGDTEPAETKKVFADGVSVENIDISGLTMDEGILKLTEEIDADLDIEITYGENKWVIPFEDIVAIPDYSEALNKAAEIEGEGNVDIDITYTCDTSMLREKIKAIAEEINADRQDDPIGFDIDMTAADVLDMLEDGKIEPVELSLTEEEQEKQERSLLGSFSTAFSDDDKNRNENLRVACEKINNTVLEPGEIFDMNEALGPQTYENGYKAAGVIENGKIVSALGGGVCQVTTTIYNAAIFAELEIVERYNHSLMVGYVPLGRDAAVAGTYKNLRFKNNTDQPIIIETYLENNNVVCDIYGHETRDPDRKIDFESVWIRTIGKPAEKVTQDPNMYEDERVVTYYGKTGAKIDTYKLVYDGDELVSREWFSSSTYIATADEVTVGTKPRVQEDLPVIGSPDSQTPPETTVSPESPDNSQTTPEEGITPVQPDKQQEQEPTQTPQENAPIGAADAGEQATDTAEPPALGFETVIGGGWTNE